HVRRERAPRRLDRLLHRRRELRPIRPQPLGERARALRVVAERTRPLPPLRSALRRRLHEPRGAALRAPPQPPPPHPPDARPPPPVRPAAASPPAPRSSPLTRRPADSSRGSPYDASFVSPRPSCT